ncbi:MAG: Uma2 family endonuclease [Planctomycetes bacterium]|nr:Uma2 family endonuclease [Planctomycetota bacterium]
MARPQVRYTYEDYRQLPDDGRRYEVLDGELVVSPSPSRRHQQLSARLVYELYRHVEAEHRLGEVYHAPSDVILAEDTIVQPDLLFVATERLDAFSDRGLEGAPDLVVEILSPSTRARDRGKKREVYARFGVRELWLVDPDRDAVDVFERAGGDLAPAGIFGRGDTLASRVVPGLRIDLAALFA